MSIHIGSWMAATALTVTGVVGTVAVRAGETATERSLATSASQALSPDSAIAETAIAALRRAGPQGLVALAHAHEGLLRQYARSETSDSLAADERWERLCRAFDGVGAATNNHAARLYWYTDYDEARAAALASGKPILSLRLLGNLDEELSCANSRFFRAILYSDPRVAALLRDRFVLHWKSVRPVPKVTIDLGDGRMLQRTVTGNSIHYVIDADGRLLDGLPGLYGPVAFVRELERILEARARFAAPGSDAVPADGVKRGDPWGLYHARRAYELVQAWRADLGRLRADAPIESNPDDFVRAGAAPTAGRAATVALTKMRSEAMLVDAPSANDAALRTPTKREAGAALLEATPTALEAAPIGVTKAGVEVPMLVDWERVTAPLARATDDAEWRRIAALHRADAELSPPSRRLVAEMSRWSPICESTGPTPLPAPIDHHLIERRIEALTDSVALDTVRNEYLLHRRLHEWLATQTPIHDVDEFDERVYAELFLTPGSDPWLGLVTPDAFTALPADGVRHAARPGGGR